MINKDAVIFWNNNGKNEDNIKLVKDLNNSDKLYNDFINQTKLTDKAAEYVIDRFSKLEDQNGQKKQDGWVKEHIIGTYVHGIFEEGTFTERLIQSLLEQKGISQMEQITSFRDYKEKQYDLLANIVRDHIDMDLLYRIIGISN